MKRLIRQSAIVLGILSCCSPCLGQFLWPEVETYQQISIDKKTKVMRSRLDGNFKHLSNDRFVLKEAGLGNYGSFNDISWKLESQTESREDLLCPLYTLFTIRNRENRIISTLKNDYDYQDKIIHIRRLDENMNIIEQQSLPLKERTTDYATLIYFLKPFLDDLIAGETIRFHFVSSEPGLYKLKAELLKEDSIMVESQKIETVQIKINTDMGFLNAIVDQFVPPTLLWYSKDKPRVWLKYEGLESGRGSAHILTTVENFTSSFSSDPVKNAAGSH